jgi:site-specific recombinase XerD
MTPYQKRLTDVTRRLAGDLKIRNRAQATIDAYTYHVQRFADFTKKPLDRATPEDVRNFQLHLIEERKVSYSSFNQAVCAIRFLYTTTIPRKWPVAMIPFGKRPKKLPTVLSRQEVEDLLRCTNNLKHRAFLMTLYAAGLRLAECSHLKVTDIDSQRMQLRIACGKGNKERHVPLSPRLLEALRTYWKKYRPPTYLFPGKTTDKPYAATSIQKAIKVSARRAGIKKTVHPHVLRHSYATGLLEAGVDILTISRLLGHASFATTMIYLHVRREHLQSTPSPLDWLPVRQLPGWHQPTPQSHSNPPTEPPANEPPANEPPANEPPANEPPTNGS